MPDRICQDDRERAVQLKEAFAEDRLSRADLDDLLQLAQTPADPVPALALLPAPDLVGRRGRFRRRGAWRVRRVLKIESEYGRVDLDLARAVLEGRRGRHRTAARIGGRCLGDLDELHGLKAAPLPGTRAHSRADEPGSAAPWTTGG